LPSRSKQAKSPEPTKAQTYLPSVLGEAEARLPSSVRARKRPEPSLRFHSSLPLVLMHTSTRSLPSSLVRRRRSPQTTGVEPPMPGICKLQAMFSSWPQCVGRLVSVLTPSFAGPRHCGQLSARANPTNEDAKRHARSRERAEVEYVTVGSPRRIRKEPR